LRENSTESRDSWRFWLLLALVGIALPAAWIVTIVNSVGFDNAIQGIGTGSPSMIYAIGAFGSSFGFLAAIFSGLAVALLWRNLEISQRELNQLKKQMEEDRNLSVFLKMLDLFQETRSTLSDAANNESPLRGKAAIDYYALQLQEMRRRGDFSVDDPLSAMKDFFHAPLNPFPRNFDLTVSDYCQLTAEMIRFISSVSPAERRRFSVFLKGLLSTMDYIVLHEYFLLNYDRDFQDALSRSGFFKDVGLPLCLMLQGGAFFSVDVYGEQVASAVNDGKLKL